MVTHPEGGSIAAAGPASADNMTDRTSVRGGTSIDLDRANDNAGDGIETHPVVSQKLEVFLSFFGFSLALLHISLLDICLQAHMTTGVYYRHPGTAHQIIRNLGNALS